VVLYHRDEKEPHRQARDAGNVVLEMRRPGRQVPAARAGVLTHNQCELGIEPVFWQNEETGEDEAPAILTMKRPG
jgi:hypothetical protein